MSVFIILAKEEGNISEKIIQLNENAVKTEIKDLVRKSVEETLNYFLARLIFGYGDLYSAGLMGLP